MLRDLPSLVGVQAPGSDARKTVLQGRLAGSTVERSRTRDAEFTSQLFAQAIKYKSDRPTGARYSITVIKTAVMNHVVK